MKERLQLEALANKIHQDSQLAAHYREQETIDAFEQQKAAAHVRELERQKAKSIESRPTIPSHFRLIKLRHRLLLSHPPGRFCGRRRRRCEMK